ncbi:MAG: hypothetical protein HKM05_00995 [Spirochaetales bacterium]|nr:hypothetical protein [Spirochaetales bacterium]
MHDLACVQKASSLLRPVDDLPDVLTLDRMRARLTEVSTSTSGGGLSALAPVLLVAQKNGHLTGWVEAGPTIFFPPDLSFLGVDTSAIVVAMIRPDEALLAADWLCRSGAFGVLIIDNPPTLVSESALGRLARLAENHDVALVFLTRKTPDTPSLGSLISLRIAVDRQPDDRVVATILRDRRYHSHNRQRWDLYGPHILF